MMMVTRLLSAKLAAFPFVWFKRVAALSLAFVLLVPQAGRADDRDGQRDALPFAKSYTITGNYVVGGVDLGPQPGGNGLATGTISMSGVPANADVLAAFLYWETISTQTSQVNGATFRGFPITVVKATSATLDGDNAGCWLPGTGPRPTLTMFRADVLRFLPLQRDSKGVTTGRSLVNDSDLASTEKLTVTLPQAAAGSGVPQTAGATLLVIYRDPTQPLTSIVLYEGARVQKPGETITQTLRGFLQSSTSRSAKMTHIVGSGTPNTTERLWFNGTQIATDPFHAAGNTSSDRGWSNPTFNVTPQMPGRDPGLGYGEEVTTSVDYRTPTPSSCLAWNAIVFSTAVQDTDGDGLVDLLESRSGLKEPDGHHLPDIHAMGADPLHKDLFIEIGAMKADPGTGYGSAAAPFNATTPRMVDADGHNHMPSPAVLKMVGDAYDQSPVTNPDGRTGIKVHFDVGPFYHFLGTPYRSTDADRYLVNPFLARGGESLTEVACVPSATLKCQFPDYPGTLSWKIGFQLVRDAIVGPFGEQLSKAERD